MARLRSFLRFLTISMAASWLIVTVNGQGKDDSAICQTFTLNTSTCKAAGITNPVQCFAQQASMKTIMDCVKFDHREDDRLCIHSFSRTDDGMEYTNLLSDDFLFDLTPQEKHLLQKRCFTPRQVLVQTARSCSSCGLAGLFASCPRNDPLYYNCVCELIKDDYQLQGCSTCFGATSGLGDDTLDLIKICRKAAGRGTVRTGGTGGRNPRRPFVARQSDEIGPRAVLHYYQPPTEDFIIAILSNYRAWAYDPYTGAWSAVDLPFYDSYIQGDDMHFNRVYKSPFRAITYTFMFEISDVWPEYERELAIGAPEIAVYNTTVALSTVTTPGHTPTATPPPRVTMDPVEDDEMIIDDPSSVAGGKWPAHPTMYVLIGVLGVLVLFPFLGFY